jgi:mersacidin/lichenicidin family type 2 lantibiotic
VAIDIERALRDPEYRKTLSPEELSQLPTSPEDKSPDQLSEEDLGKVAGGAVPGVVTPKIQQ